MASRSDFEVVQKDHQGREEVNQVVDLSSSGQTIEEFTQAINLSKRLSKPCSSWTESEGGTCSDEGGSLKPARRSWEQHRGVPPRIPSSCTAPVLPGSWLTPQATAPGPTLACPAAPARAPNTWPGHDGVLRFCSEKSTAKRCHNGAIIRGTPRPKWHSRLTFLLSS